MPTIKNIPACIETIPFLFMIITSPSIFIIKLVEDDTMKQHHPEEFAKSEADNAAWNDKWNTYRLEASDIFATLGRLGYIPIKERE